MCQTSEEPQSATSRSDTVLCLRGIGGMWAGTGIRRSGFGGILVAGVGVVFKWQFDWFMCGIGVL